MNGINDGRVAIITGAGRGIGREEALEFARSGARVVINDVGSAQEVAAEIQAMGGQAVANGDDVSDWDGAGRIVQTALDTFGRLDIIVNNAGILRDRMLVNMSVQEWDAVINVHLRGTFCVTRHAIDHWRGQAKAGTPVDARIINTSSPTGLYGNVGQANYGAAKAAIAALTVIAADELGRIGVTANAIAPSALTAMTEGLGDYVAKLAELKQRTGFDAGSPANVAPLVVWLGSPASKAITGRVFNIRGGHISIAETWSKGPEADKDARWEIDELDELIPALVAKARPNSDGRGNPRVQAI